MMQIPPNAADAGTEWAAHPLPTGADVPLTLGKEGSPGDTSDSSMSPQKHHPSPGHAATSAGSNPNHGEPRHTRTNQQGFATPASTRQHLSLAGIKGGLRKPRKPPQPCQRQGDINWGIHSTAVWGIPPSPPHQNPIPTHPPRCPQHGETSHNHSVLSTKYLRHRPSINTLLSIAMQNFLILPLARTPLSARDKYQSSFT